MRGSDVVIEDVDYLSLPVPYGNFCIVCKTTKAEKRWKREGALLLSGTGFRYWRFTCFGCMTPEEQAVLTLQNLDRPGGVS